MAHKYTAAEFAKTLNFLSVVAIVLFVVIDASDLAKYLLQPSSYRFGTEVSGFSYTSSYHFLGSIFATFVFAVIAIAAPLILHERWAYIAVRVAVAAVLTITSL